ncbi:SWI/SNF-related matrix-associated actin-dependent regulator of chromatin subfamily A containing DEAD/H box 1 homolog [Macrosteles quadrilineatus]|uniref:SWI/SNF-related matrix-associated actin-dependent regulator of chromatin subfamily A containing DEAD/H box 1 homolog n=1 Tax=Macrosteles quadrilineatus TaxID=74068 RepID=UPI0023E23C95|nr:SWI/SNF-related matrix-associated actin-dependent regulator of chromatin subfamily A containing DEAD/H box 1 homolog [Macrosteles quadrilineatus]
MSQSSPSILNSLMRYRFQRKVQFNNNDSLSQQSEQSQETDTDSYAGSSTDTDSVIKPVQIGNGNMINSENQSDAANNMESVWKNLGVGKRLKNITVSEVVSVKQEDRVTHAISDSEDENEDKNGQSVPVEEDDDDDVIFVSNPRSRTPRPIILSDDDDDPPVNSNNQNSFCSEDTSFKKEPEIFIVDDDSNSVEIIGSDSETKPNVETTQKQQETQAEPQVNGKRKATSESPRPKAKRRRKRKKINSDSEDENSRGPRVFDSDADTDEEISGEMTESQSKVFNFFNTATEGELKLVPSVTVKKLEAIQKFRPFNGWKDLVTKFQTEKFLSTNLLNGAQQVLEARGAVSYLMRKCEKIAQRTENAIAAGSHSITQQPSILNPELKLMPYQMVGLNWLNVMNLQRLSGILADEMGLGKTIQVIAFLAHLKETGQTEANSPHLIVVPASTLENWCIEFEKWCPSLKVEQYYGSPEDRRWLRHAWFKDGFLDTEVVLTTYSMVGSCYEERKMFRVKHFHYVVFDEAHMLKNMNTQRYENLININALHRILLTGTPLQNNLLELMSLLVFVMPDMFSGKSENLKFLFSKNPKQNIEDAPLFEQEQVRRAKRIIHPFILRRLKVDVLKDLPTKTSTVVKCAMEEDQAAKYAELLEEARDDTGREINSMTIMMRLRKMANHPLTLRYHYQDDMLAKIAQLLSTDPTYKENDPERILEDLQWMSDHQLHKLVKVHKCLSGNELPDPVLVLSGKFLKLDEILPPLKETGHKVLIFSQFVFLLDIMEDYMRVRQHNFLRLDGSTPVCDRQDMIDEFNEDESIFVFLLSTKAGGIGINLTAADTVIIHDVDFNPYNDKQAEDRCHRMGQTRPVTIMRFVSEGTIEEAILRIAQEKLHLEREVTSIKDDEVMATIDVAQLLRESLGISKAS